MIARTKLVLDRWLGRTLKGRVILSLLLIGAALVTIAWLVHLAGAPVRFAGKTVSLDAYGVPGVEVRIVHPTRLSAGQATEPGAITVLARALGPTDTLPVTLFFPLPDDSIAFVDSTGAHVGSRLRVTPGYPDALPYDLLVTHGNTQVRNSLLASRRVRIVPLLQVDEETVAVPALAFEMRLESRLGQALRLSVSSFAFTVTPYLLLAAILAVLGWLWYRKELERRKSREMELAKIYGHARELIKLEKWNDARQEIDRMLLLQPGYRDVDQLDTLVGSAETAAWRREQLYRMGTEAYSRREWPEAVQAFATIEGESPYYRDVRFLKRTALLYADLHSRDRSRRVAAAQELGDIADLIDLAPLISALGDHSDDVAGAAEQAFRRIGLQATDVLISGLAHRSPDVRQRTYHLLEGLGQGARERLLGALRSSDVHVTSAASALLAQLGARQELVGALLWIGPEHYEGLFAAIQKEGASATPTLLDALLLAPQDRVRVILDALAALKAVADVNRRIEEALRGTRDPAQRALLQQALSLHSQEAPPGPDGSPAGRPEGSAVASEVTVEAVPGTAAAKPTGSRRLRLLDRR
ncbi:MAG: HEAT repeat domain-containing protein [Anaerolineae bacterium]